MCWYALMSAPTRTVIGTVRAPSGFIVVGDPEHLGYYSGMQRPSFPHAPDGERATDYRIEGPDAVAVARGLGAVSGSRYVYDVRREARKDWIARIDPRHEAHAVPEPERIPHRVRVTRALSEGHGIVAMWDLRVVVVEASRASIELGGGSWVVLEDRELQVPPLPGMRALVAIDLEALDSWRVDTPVDGLCDVHVTGPDAARVARDTGMHHLGEQLWGLVDVAEAIAGLSAMAAERAREDGAKVLISVRPHSHRDTLMQLLRSDGSATMLLGGGVCVAWLLEHRSTTA
ncbi:MAG: hypothetical protein ACI9WU_000301 [Myxococcota bacterium]|jgi:hypothetical protein